eukprot:2051371-Amphidinium_carterae.1
MNSKLILSPSVMDKQTWSLLHCRYEFCTPSSRINPRLQNQVALSKLIQYASAAMHGLIAHMDSSDDKCPGHCKSNA